MGHWRRTIATATALFVAVLIGALVPLPAEFGTAQTTTSVERANGERQIQVRTVRHEYKILTGVKVDPIITGYKFPGHTGGIYGVDSTTRRAMASL